MPTEEKFLSLEVSTKKRWHRYQIEIETFNILKCWESPESIFAKIPRRGGGGGSRLSWNIARAGGPPILDFINLSFEICLGWSYIYPQLFSPHPLQCPVQNFSSWDSDWDQEIIVLESQALFPKKPWSQNWLVSTVEPSMQIAQIFPILT